MNAPPSSPSVVGALLERGAAAPLRLPGWHVHTHEHEEDVVKDVTTVWGGFAPAFRATSSTHASSFCTSLDTTSGCTASVKLHVENNPPAALPSSCHTSSSSVETSTTEAEWVGRTLNVDRNGTAGRAGREGGRSDDRQAGMAKKPGVGSAAAHGERIKYTSTAAPPVA